MSEWYKNQNKSCGNFSQLLQERIEKANPRRELTADETKRLNKLGRKRKTLENQSKVHGL